LQYNYAVTKKLDLNCHLLEVAFGPDGAAAMLSNTITFLSLCTSRLENVIFTEYNTTLYQVPGARFVKT